MNQDEMKTRTKEFAKPVVLICRQLPNTEEARSVRNQLFRAGTAVGANYRAACRGRSRADWISKMGIVLEEADESVYWTEIIVETGILDTHDLHLLMDEAQQLVRIFVATLNTARE
jgi:four helix bundle protein